MKKIRILLLLATLCPLLLSSCSKDDIEPTLNTLSLRGELHDISRTSMVLDRITDIGGKRPMHCTTYYTGNVPAASFVFLVEPEATGLPAGYILRFSDIPDYGYNAYFHFPDGSNTAFQSGSLEVISAEGNLYTMKFNGILYTRERVKGYFTVTLQDIIE